MVGASLGQVIARLVGVPGNWLRHLDPSPTRSSMHKAMEDILNGLNNAQKDAVTCTASVLQVLAPPGSGKTKTLTARVAYLIAHQHLQPWNIIVCTFTVKAANEMKERIKAFVGQEIAKSLQLGTFHSVALRYLKRYGHKVGLPRDFGIADTADSRSILKRIIKKFGLSIEPGPVLGRISARKIKSITSDKASRTVEQQEFDRLFAEYEAALEASNLLDYDDLLLRCRTLLQAFPDCVSNVEAVLIDEFQDTNSIQYDLMGLFAQRRNAITIVGDPDQSIYGFRMAEIENLARMKSRWKNTLTINLEQNYRSSGAILQAAQKIIEEDENRPPKRLQATHTFGLRPVLRKLPSASAEAEWLVSEIKRLRALSGGLLEASDFAVLLRSAVLSRVIETALGNVGIPYRMVGGTKFYDRIEVKLVIDYLRVIHQPSNTEAVARIINVPPRRIGEETVKRLREAAEEKQKTLWDLVLEITQGRSQPTTKLTEPSHKGLSAFVNVIMSGRKKVATWDTDPPSLVDLMSLVSQKISLQSWLKSKYTEEEHEARWLNFEELMAQAADLSSPTKLRETVEADGLPEIAGLDQRQDSLADVLSVFLANVALTAATEKQAEANGEKVHQVTISTIHAAKGLEWPVVFVPACYDGSIPHSRADDHDEERRLLYVGMTRAQGVLYLSSPIKNNQKEETCLSVFLTQPDVSFFFEEHGPSLPLEVVSSLAETLRRTRPGVASVIASRREVESEEDNRWPLNGEELLEDWPSRHHPPQNTALLPTVTAQQDRTVSSAPSTLPGFASVTSRFDELMERSHENRIEKRVQQRGNPVQMAKGRKRQIEGQGGIANFFAKRGRPSDVEMSRSAPRAPLDALRTTANAATNTLVGKLPAGNSPGLATYKPLTAPMSNRPTRRTLREDEENQSKYVFLSSSPTKDVDGEADEATRGTEVVSSGHQPQGAFRPARTLHKTSVDQAAPPRKTLGVRRSLQGWRSGS